MPVSRSSARIGGALRLKNLLSKYVEAAQNTLKANLQNDVALFLGIPSRDLTIVAVNATLSVQFNITVFDDAMANFVGEGLLMIHEVGVSGLFALS